MIRLFRGDDDVPMSHERVVYIDRPRVAKEIVTVDGKRSRAIYAGSFDPIHNGHIDAITRASSLFDELEVAVGMNSAKKYTFTLDERVAQVKQALSNLKNVSVNPFDGLLVRHAYRTGVKVILKGVRNTEDFRLESTYHEVGSTQDLGIETLLLPSNPEVAHISSTAVKLLQEDEGDIHAYVPLFIKQVLEERISGRYMLGITGQMGSGKSYVGEQFVRLGKEMGIQVSNIELDEIGHEVLGATDRYREVREAILKEFGLAVSPDGKMNRRKLMEKILERTDGLEVLSRLMRRPIIAELYNLLRNKRGLVMVNGALLAESGTTCLCNNNVVLVQADGKTRESRLSGRNVPREQMDYLNSSQYTFEQKREYLAKTCEKDRNGMVWIVANNGNGNEQSIRKTFLEIVRHMKCKP